MLYRVIPNQLYLAQWWLKCSCVVKILIQNIRQGCWGRILDSDRSLIAKTTDIRDVTVQTHSWSPMGYNTLHTRVDHFANQEVLRRLNTQVEIMNTIKKRKLEHSGHIVRNRRDTSCCSLSY